MRDGSKKAGLGKGLDSLIPSGTTKNRGVAATTKRKGNSKSCRKNSRKDCGKTGGYLLEYYGDRAQPRPAAKSI